MWREVERSRLLNRARRRALETPQIAAIYWRRQERKAPLRAKLARAALSQRHVNEAFWRIQDSRAEKRRATLKPRPTLAKVAHIACCIKVKCRECPERSSQDVSGNDSTSAGSRQDTWLPGRHCGQQPESGSNSGHRGTCR